MKWYKRILIPTDGSDRTKPAITSGLEMAKLMNAEVTALSVIDVGDFASSTQGLGISDRYAYLESVAEAAVEYVKQKGRELGVEVQTKITRGNPAMDIIQASGNYDLIVMGTLGRTGLAHMLVGSVAEKVVRNSVCPVMVVRETK
jgi:nucleotide-binding universal stress UspA family protein